MNNQKGSILLWIIVGIFILAAALGGGWLYVHSQAKNNLAEELANDRVMPAEVTQVAPQPSPDYSLAKEKYHLNDKQLEILSHVVDDGKL